MDPKVTGTLFYFEPLGFRHHEDVDEEANMRHNNYDCACLCFSAQT